MVYDFERFSEIMQKLDISPNQIYICMLLMEKSMKKKVELFTKYKIIQEGFEYEDLEVLVNKGYLEDFNSDKVPRTVFEHGKRRQITELKTFDLFMVTDKFKEGIWIDSEEAALEAWQSFPTWMKINEKSTNIKNMVYDEFVEHYSKIISGNGVLHRKIVTAFSHFRRFVKAGKVTGMGIKKALDKKLWNDIEELLELEEDDKDVIESI